MMIGMIVLLLCVTISDIMTTDAAFLLNHQIQKFHEFGYDQDQRLLSPGLSRKLMLKKMDEDYRDQDLGFYNDKEKTLYVAETWKRGEELVVIETQESDPTQFTSMDYSRVRRKRPIHNNASPKPAN